MQGEGGSYLLRVVVNINNVIMYKFNISYSCKSSSFYKGITLEGKSFSEVERKFKKLFDGEIKGIVKIEGV